MPAAPSVVIWSKLPVATNSASTCSMKNVAQTLPVPDRLLVIACGMIAREVLTVKELNGLDNLELTCLPAELHYYPDRISPASPAGSFGRCRRPRGSVTNSASPPVSPTTSGTPAAAASSATMPNGSYELGAMTTSELA